MTDAQATPGRGQARATVPRLALVTAVAECIGGTARAAGDQLTAARIPLFDVEVRATPRRLKPVKSLVRVCCDSTQRLFDPGEDPVETVRITVGSAAGRSPNPLRAVVTEDASATEVAHAAISALLQRHVLRLHRRNDPPAGDLEWLVAAMVYEVQHAIRQTTAVTRTLPDQRAAYALFAGGKFPDLTKLLANPVRPNAGLPYQLYAVHCNVVARLIDGGPRRVRPRPLQRVLDLQARGRDPVAAIAFTVHGRLRPGETLQGWYEREAAQLSRHGSAPLPADEVLKRLREFETIPTVMPGRHAAGFVRVPIDEVPDLLKASKVDKGALQHIQGQIFELAKTAPITLQPALIAYIEAFKKLEKGRKGAFRHQLKRARRELSEAAARQERIDAYLDTVEERNFPAEMRFAAELDTVRRSRERRRRLDPELHEYLDTLER